MAAVKSGVPARLRMRAGWSSKRRPVHEMNLGGPGGRLSSWPPCPSSCGQAERSIDFSTMLLNATLTLWTFGDSILDCGRWAAAACGTFWSAG